MSRVLRGKYVLNKLTEFFRDTAKKFISGPEKKVKIFHQSKYCCIHNLISLPYFNIGNFQILITNPI